MSNAFFPFDQQQRIGASIVFTFALLSAVPLTVVILRTVWIRLIGATSRDGAFFKSQLGYFVGCLLVANVATAINGVTEIGWIVSDGVQHGPTCTMQGVLGEIGELANAYFTVVLGVHILVTLALRSHHSQWFVPISIVIGWAAPTLIGACSASVHHAALGPLYGFATLNCSVTVAYPAANVIIYSVPIFISCLSSTIVYSLAFLTLRGNITINGGFKLRMHIDDLNWRSQDAHVIQYRRFIRAVAHSIIWFPTVFMLCVIPNAIVRLADISGYRASPPIAAFTLAIRHMNGLLDVIVLLNILRVLGPAFQVSPSSVAKFSDTAGGVSSPSHLNRSFKSFPPGQSTFYPIPTHGRKPYQTHKHNGSNGSSTDSVTGLILSGWGGDSSADSGSARQRPSNSGQSRTVTKSMISKPTPADLDMIFVAQHDHCPPPSHSGSQGMPFVGMSRHSTVLLSPLSEAAQDSLLAKPVTVPPISQLTMRKPLPLLPQDDDVRSCSRSSANISAGKIPAQNTTPCMASTPPAASSYPLMAPESAIVRDEDRAYALHLLSKSAERSSSPEDRHCDPEPTVIRLYMSSRRSLHEDMLPEFPITASEFQVESRTSQFAKEPQDFSQPACSHTVQSSPSSPASVVRPLAARSSYAASLLIQDAPLATAVVTEFDVDEYLSSPAPPVPALATSNDHNNAKDMDNIEHMHAIAETTDADERPGLPPLPAFRARLTIYDDELSARSVSTAGWGFGTRPMSSIRTVPLPPHLHLQVNMSPVALRLPDVVPPTRGFRPIL